MNIDIENKEYSIDSYESITTQEQLDEFQRCFNNVKHDYEEVIKLEDKVMFNTEELKDYGDDVCNGLENILEEDVDENYLNDDERQVLEKALAVIKSKMEELL